MTSNHLIDTLLSKHPQVFLLCCDLCNFSSVARALQISQSAVSKAILELEDELGFTLFDRTCRPLKPTHEALILREHISRILYSTEELLTQIREDNAIKQVLRIGVTEALSTSLGMAIVREMNAKVSRMEITVLSSGFLYQQLKERKLDAVFTNDATPPDEHIARKAVFDEPSVLILPKSMDRGPDYRWTWEALNCCGLPLIRFGEATGAGQVNEAFLRLQGYKAPKRLIVQNNTMLLTLVAEGLGWVYARPTTLLQNKHLIERLYIAPLPAPNLIRQVHLFYREKEYGTQMAELLRFAKNCLRDKIFPEIYTFAPWVKPLMKIASEEQE